MGGKLYRLTASIETYFWSGGGGEPHDSDTQAAVEESIKDAGADWITADVVEEGEIPLFDWAQDALVYGDHDGDLTLARAIELTRETKAFEAFAAKQGMLL